MRICNKVFVLDEGKISQQGSFDELSKTNGFFRDSLSKQMSILGKNDTFARLKKAI